MVATFVKAHWGALLVSLMALGVQQFLPEAAVVPVLLVLTTLAWGVTSACALRHQSSHARVQAEQSSCEFLDETTSPMPDESGLLSVACHEAARHVGHTEAEQEPTSALVVPQDVALNHALRGLLADIAQTVHDELTLIRDGLGQTRTLVNDAVGKMSESFHGLHAQAQKQTTLVRSLIENQAGTMTQSDATQISMQQFTDETSEVLQYFIDLVGDVSKEARQNNLSVYDLGVRV